MIFGNPHGLRHDIPDGGHEATILGDGWKLVRSEETAPLVSASSQIDLSWEDVDDAGHLHQAQALHATCVEVVDESHHCDGHEGYFPHDPHEHVDRSHFECRDCGQVIEPRMLPPGSVQYMTVGVSWTLSTIRYDGMTRVERTVRVPGDDPSGWLDTVYETFITGESGWDVSVFNDTVADVVAVIDDRAWTQVTVMN